MCVCQLAECNIKVLSACSIYYCCSVLVEPFECLFTFSLVNECFNVSVKTWRAVQCSYPVVSSHLIKHWISFGALTLLVWVTRRQPACKSTFPPVFKSPLKVFLVTVARPKLMEFELISKIVSCDGCTVEWSGGKVNCETVLQCYNARRHSVIIIAVKKVAHTRLQSVGFSELIPVLGSQPAGDVSHERGGRLPLLSAKPEVTPAMHKRAATNFAAWWTEARWVWTVCLRLLPDNVTAAIWTQALLRLSPAC